MRVYHFLPAIHALDGIRKQRLKISEIDQLNDPSELWCVSLEDRRLRLALREYKKEMTKHFGMICFCKHWHNPLLWSHYADKHRGVCLGFDVDDRGLRQVDYVEERSDLTMPPTKESADELLFTKCRDWRYEEELRNWFKLDEREGGHYFYPFDRFVQLREVIIGPLCATRKEDIEDALRTYQDSVTITKARLAFRTFRVVENLQGFRPQRVNKSLGHSELSFIEPGKGLETN
jgi:hypothetical protein